MEKITVSNIEINLPRHMESLDQDTIEVIRKFPDSKFRVICCGVDPTDSSLCLITGEGEVRLVVPNGDTIPTEAIPSYDGTGIHVVFRDERKLTLDAKVVIQHSSEALNKSTLFVNDKYMCDVDLKEIDLVPVSHEDKTK